MIDSMSKTPIISAMTKWFQVGNKKVIEVSAAFVVSLITTHRNKCACSQFEQGQTISQIDALGKCTPSVLSKICGPRVCFHLYFF